MKLIKLPNHAKARKSSKNVEQGVPQKAQNGADSSSDGDAAASGIDESDKGERIGDVNH